MGDQYQATLMPFTIEQRVLNAIRQFRLEGTRPGQLDIADYAGCVPRQVGPAIRRLRHDGHMILARRGPHFWEYTLENRE